ncbi:MAG: PKD domain-containing protein [Nitrospiraceae bacterium]
MRYSLLPFLLTFLFLHEGALALGARAFTITTPQPNAVVRSGQDIAVSVDIGTGIAVRQVRYYWYRQDEEPIGSQQAEPTLVASVASEQPFGGTVRIPASALGTMRLLAVGDVTRGRLTGHEEFDEILVRVEAPSALSAIEFSTEKPWRLNTIGQIMDVPVVGQFADGIVRRLDGPSSGSTYRTSDEHVVEVFPDGSARATGNGKATITVANRGKEETLEVVVAGDPEPNRPPVARTSTEVTAKAGATVTLDGLQSHDPDGDPLRYEWKQHRGNKVTLMNHDQAKAIFTAPRVSAKRLLQFGLRVTDMRGPDTVKGADSFWCVVSVWVEP